VVQIIGCLQWQNLFNGVLDIAGLPNIVAKKSFDEDRYIFFAVGRQERQEWELNGHTIIVTLWTMVSKKLQLVLIKIQTNVILSDILSCTQLLKIISVYNTKAATGKTAWNDDCAQTFDLTKLLHGMPSPKKGNVAANLYIADSLFEKFSLPASYFRKVIGVTSFSKVLWCVHRVAIYLFDTFSCF
jgi:hypothetical protein